MSHRRRGEARAHEVYRLLASSVQLARARLNRFAELMPLDECIIHVAAATSVSLTPTILLLSLSPRARVVPFSRSISLRER